MSSQRRIPVRRRGQVLEDALLAAAWAELSTTGYSGLTMDTVAARARTSKVVLYRRWPNRAELALAALRKHAKVSLEIPDTGTLRDDVLAVLRWLCNRHRDFQEILQGLMIELSDAGPVQQTSTEMMRAVLQRWTARGEIDAGKMTSRILDLPLDLARYEMFVSRKPLSESAMREIVDDVFIPLLDCHASARRRIRGAR